jgi:hypothetical protein
MGKIHHMNPAAFVISKVGGPKKVALITGEHYTRVCRWRYPEGSRYGTGGVVPHTAAMKLLRWSKRYKKGIRASHFMQFPSRAA